MSPELTLEDVEKRLAYTGVTLAVHEHQSSVGTLSFAVFTIHPQPATSDAVELIFDADVRFIQSVRFGAEPHWHFEGSDEEGVNVKRAIRVARALVHQRVHLVRQLDSLLKSWAWSLHVKNGLPTVFDRRITHFRRAYFNRPQGDPFPVPPECRHPSAVG